MGLEDLRRALDWAATEGWNPGLGDAEAFLAADPEGFFVADIDEQTVAAISVVNHGPEFAFLGLYLCLPQYRGQSIGYGLWQHALTHAGDRVVGLDGVPDQQPNYRKSGFDLTGQTYRFSGSLAGRQAKGLRPVSSADIPDLIALEAHANGYAKPGFMSAWLTDMPARRSLVLGDVPRGFVTIRTCRDGYKIGPLVAESIADAETLIRGAVDLMRPGEVMIDVPDDCVPLMRFCEDEGLTVSFNTARMYRGSPPRVGALLRAIATMELG
ncbi:GNAT family N-acetyltransferase [Aestuariivita sp.]|jgi:GNAT superfamily N-acetyltransferase|uniref:GNAT family N-acetyltransferase n=1 Tax=Aestuariivita sp. TaxID=1872407 RepID=UPI00216E09F1|nr:GNAT family N-acetyltransferase [Aestuariivita sp.]MCE8008145.1 GNAT family N-acetyltransferase [Aestuariivita sp.]